ncbi:hypothetical protein [Nitratiruptor sp. SB155-2]|uniref:hypothetical protein n=1 Tax=Nitratiruptor sp. (strain SB155-2) TaxID=387092 RepID=UPI0001586F9C|nr:hypothetical protein [Nitratiruptor sp. SB155-2]BAF69625.1 conserved hypothetical protein [Nitratiruptor sp. SB155-2]
MKKIGLFLIVSILIGLVGIYGLLFTKSGNQVLKPEIESYLNQKLPVKVALRKFQIAPMDIVLEIGKSIAVVHGDLNPLQRRFDLTYNIKIDDLAALEPLHRQKLRGPLNTKGRIKGTLDQFTIKGISDIAKSGTEYTVVVKELNPESLTATIKNADLAQLQYMVYQPVRTYGFLNSDIKLDSLNVKNLKGSIVSQILHGKVNEKEIEKEFGIKKATINYRIDQKSILDGQKITTKMSFDSTIATANLENVVYNLKNNTLTIPYVVDIPNLSKLYFLTNRRMRGKITVTGKVQKAKDLVVTAHSQTLGGTVDAVLKNSDLHAKLKNIEVTALTYMLYYPKIFDSSMEADLKYNISTQKGTLVAKAYDGRILPNKMTFLLQQMANFDITREVYKVTALHSIIDKKKILSNLDMESRLTHISSKDALVDLQKEYVNAKLKVEIKKRPVFVKIKGSLKSPKVSVDAKALLKDQVKQKLQKKLKNKIPAEAEKLLNLF